MIVERKSIFLSIVELHSSLTITHLTAGMVQRRLFMMFLIHQAFMTTEFILVVGSSNWKNGKFVIIAAQTSYSLTDDSYLSLRHPSVISVTRIVLPSRFCFTPGTCPFMSAFICLSRLSLYLHYPFLPTYAHYWISWWSRNSNFFNLESRNCFIMLLRNFMMWSPLISSTYLIIMKEWIANQDIIEISIISIHPPIPIPKSPSIYIVYIDVLAYFVTAE